jgi:hypothetical protein
VNAEVFFKNIVSMSRLNRRQYWHSRFFKKKRGGGGGGWWGGAASYSEYYINKFLGIYNVYFCVDNLIVQ